MLMKLWPGDWENNLETMKIRVDELNGRDMGMEKEGLVKFGGF